MSNRLLAKRKLKSYLRAADEAHDASYAKHIEVPEDHYGTIHDAWLSTRPASSDDPKLGGEYANLTLVQKALCYLTGQNILLSIHEHLREQNRSVELFGPAFMYGAMRRVYLPYYHYRFSASSPQPGLNTLAMDILRGPEPEYFRYRNIPPRSKEVDRRMVVVSMLELANPNTILCEPEVREEALLHPNTAAALADADNILASVRDEAEPYEATGGYAAEVIHWRI